LQKANRCYQIFFIRHSSLNTNREGFFCQSDKDYCPKMNDFEKEEGDFMVQEILLVEDDIDMAELITAFFKQKDIKVHHYEDPSRALKEFRAGKIDVGAIISDLNMPEMSGLEFLKKLREEGFQTPVILITVSDDVDTAFEAIQCGAYDFVVKPLHFPQLFISIQRAFKMNKLNAENSTLKKAVEVSRGINPDGMIGHSEAFRKAYDLAKRVSQSNSTVLISGESGSGKEVFARAIHQWSSRRDKPFMAINCSAIPDNLLESELFGHAKGAFTGASDKKVGLFEEAEGGTLFLDEVGDLNLPLQAKLLRVLQDRKIKRVGENQYRSIDVRVITATHKDLNTEVQEKRFRDDLFFRLNVIPLRVPALRERREDIMPLANFFLSKFNAINGTDIKGFTPAAKEYLIKNNWRGNVRELENTIERSVVLCTSKEIDASAFLVFDEDIAPVMESALTDIKNAFVFRYGETFLPLEDVEKKYIQFVFQRNNRAREATAKILGIDRKTLYRKLQEMPDSMEM